MKAITAGSFKELAKLLFMATALFSGLLVASPTWADSIKVAGIYTQLIQQKWVLLGILWVEVEFSTVEQN